jgi:hypothetical protein
MNITLSKGMVFAVYSGSTLAKAINVCQKVKSTDNESIYNHAGIIVGETGRTFEALYKIGYSDINQYKGCQVLIVKHCLMDEGRFQGVWPEIDKLDGKIYPFPRLFLHLFGLAKFVHWKYPVCSELVGKFEVEAGLRKNWWGLNPDHLADEWRISRYYDTIYEGIWEGINE